MLYEFFVTGTNAPPTAQHIRSVMETQGFTSGRIVSTIPDPDNANRISVTVAMPETGPLSERELEENRMQAKGLPLWAASYPWAVEPYWKAVEADQNLRRVTEVPAPPKRVWPKPEVD